MTRIKFEFENQSNQRLAGLLETPAGDKLIEQFAIFAHCFTCGKDIAAASRISRALASQGIAVLRFDFTGLGNSDGDFANTNFSSNIDDLLAAARALEQRYQAPSLLIGHSLGGSAVLAVAAQLESVKAIATIGTPATADHVQHLLTDASSILKRQGEANVRIGLRTFTIKQQLLDDIQMYASAEPIKVLKKAILIFHSPIDEIVPISEAAKIYQAAMHPKSFISLDQADHLLTHKQDAEYVALTLSAWASRYLQTRVDDADKNFGTAPQVAAGEVLVTELNKKFLTGLYSHSHQLLSDEPESFGGSNLGPSPYDLLLMAVGACTSMTLRMYASHKELPLEHVSVQLRHERIHAKDCQDCEQQHGYIDRIQRFIKLDGALTDEQKQRILQIADRCPVHRTLENKPIIQTRELDV